MRLAVAVVVLVAATGVRAAEPYQEAEGRAPIVNGDLVRARERALDDALRHAVEQAAQAALGARAATEAATLEAYVLGRPREFVSSYRVLEETPAADAFTLKVSARVAVDRIVAALERAPHAASPSAKPRVVACLAERVVGTWGISPSGPRLDEALAARGLDPVAPLHGCLPPPGGSEFDDPHAADAITTSGAQGAVIGAVVVDDAGVVRGTTEHAAHARLTLRAYDGAGRPVGTATVEKDAYAPDLPAAGRAVVGAALDAALAQLGTTLKLTWPTGGAIGVHVDGVTRYADLVALERALAGVPGVSAVEPRRFDATGVDLAVKGSASADDLAAALVRATPDAVRFAAHAQAATVRVSVTPAPTVGPPMDAMPPVPAQTGAPK